MRSKKLYIPLSLIILLAFFQWLISSSNPTSDLLFKVKRFEEKLIEKIITSESGKVDYKIKLLEERLHELDATVDLFKLAFIQNGSSRYITTVGEITNLITENNMKERINTTIDLFKSHKAKLNDLHTSMLVLHGYGNGIEERKAIQAAMDALDIYSEKLNQYNSGN